VTESAVAPSRAVALEFVDCINRRDLPRLSRLMSSDHRLEVFDEEPLVGREANTEAWRGYFDAFPAYVIYPDRVAEMARRVAVLGHTTGSHLGLPDEEEGRLTLIWLVDTAGGTVTRWKLVEDNPVNRSNHGLVSDFEQGPGSDHEQGPGSGR
jgi:ketosteroid isomerase-like protein